MLKILALGTIVTILALISVVFGYALLRVIKRDAAFQSRYLDITHGR